MGRKEEILYADSWNNTGVWGRGKTCSKEHNRFDQAEE